MGISISGGTGSLVSTVNIGQVGGAAITLGQKLMATSFPVVIASDQSDVGVNIDKYGGSATTLGQKLLAASVPVAIASDQGDLGVNIDKYGGSATTLGQKLLAASVPVAIASDQGDLGVNIDKFGGSATTLGQKLMASSIPMTLASDQPAIPISGSITTTQVAWLESYQYSIAGGQITTAAYTQIAASLANTVKAVEIYCTDPAAILIFATGAGGSEVNKFYIPVGGNTPLLVYFTIASSTRISVKALNTAATTGYLIMNFYG